MIHPSGCVSFERSVELIRSQPEHADLVRFSYFDDPLIDAAIRFRSGEEWDAVRSLLPAMAGTVLDLGAGRGISSYAFAMDGWDVTAVEPDPGSTVGRGALQALVSATGLPIRVMADWGEQLSCPSESIDVVYCRQVLHHAKDLPALCRQVARVLKPGGTFLATREHVIDRKEDLSTFLEQHPLHALHGGECAYLEKEYLSAITNCGLRPVNTLASFDSAINYYPLTSSDWRRRCASLLFPFVGYRLALAVTDARSFMSSCLLRFLARRLSRRDHTPGRLYSFIAEKQT